MRRHLVVLVLLATAACHEGPFVDFTDPATVTVNKDPDTIRKNGNFFICYGDSDADKVEALAQQTCREYGLVALRKRDFPWQCRVSAPNRVLYLCVDPTMRFTSGAWVNPLDPSEVKQWREERRARGGVPAPAEAPRHVPSAPPLPPDPAPTPFPLGSSFNPPPADWGDAKPPVATPQPAPQAPPSLYPVRSDFNPPVGGWGDSWDAGGR